MERGLTAQILRDSIYEAMLRHLFYSLLLIFLLSAFAEFLRPGFAVLFLNMNWLFLAVVISGALALTRGGKNNKM